MTLVFVAAAKLFFVIVLRVPPEEFFLWVTRRFTVAPRGNAKSEDNKIGEWRQCALVGGKFGALSPIGEAQSRFTPPSDEQTAPSGLCDYSRPKARGNLTPGNGRPSSDNTFGDGLGGLIRLSGKVSLASGQRSNLNNVRS